MSGQNSLSVANLPEELSTMSHLEESLVVKKLMFQKIFPLKILRMPAVKDKLIIVPIEDEDVINTKQITSSSVKMWSY